MNYYLFLARSITHAQDMANVLGRAGIGTSIRRASPAMTERGCGYSLQVNEKKYTQAAQVLKDSGRLPVKVFYVSGSNRREVVM